MPRISILLLVIFVSAGLFAQVPIPGTFSTQPIPTTSTLGGLVLSPPQVSFGSGLTPPVVVNREVTVVTAPQNMAIQPSMVNVPNQSQTIPTAVNTGATETTPGASPKRFDFVIAPSSVGESGSAGIGDQSLGQIAASLRKGPPPTQRKFTNDDIARMNGVTNNNYTMPGASTPEPTYPKTPDHAQAQLPPGAKPSPFSPKVYEQPVPDQELSAESSSEPAIMAQNNTPPRPGNENATPADQSSAQSRAANSQTTGSAQASDQRQLPPTSTLLPLLVLAGVGTTALGLVLAGRNRSRTTMPGVRK